MTQQLETKPAGELTGIRVDVGYRKLATAAALTNTFAFAAIFAITPASINEIGRTYHASKSALGMLYFIQAAAFIVTVLAGGWLSDRKGKFPVMMTGCLLMTVGAIIFALTPSLTLALLPMLLIGLGGGFTEGVAIAAVSDLYDKARRTAMLNWTQVCFGIGAVAAPMGAAQLFKLGISWRVGYLLVAGLTLMAALAALTTISRRQERPLATQGHHSDWRMLIRDPFVICLAIGIACYVGAESGQANWLAAYFEKGLETSVALAASTVAFFWGGITIGRVAATKLSGHLSDHAIILWSLGLSVLFEGTFLLTSSPIAAIAAVVGIGIAMGPVWPTVMSRAGKAHPGQTGTVFGIIIAMGSAAIAVISPLLGWAGDVYGIRAALWICFGLLVMNFALFAWLDRGRCRKPEV